MITLVYRQRLLQVQWQAAAVHLLDWLNSNIGSDDGPPKKNAVKATKAKVYGIVAYSKGVKRVIGRGDYVVETGLHRPDIDRTLLRYRQSEASFSNPNASVCQATINWLYTTCTVLKERHRVNSVPGDSSFSLLELYCGNANHTVALAPLFANVVGVEINPRLVTAARNNLRDNGVTNARIVHGDCKRFSRDTKVCSPTPESSTATVPVQRQQHHSGWTVRCRVKSRSLQQQQATDALTKTSLTSTRPDSTAHPQTVQSEIDFAASVVLVDPPRGGLDEHTRALVQQFHFIIYISCNPQSLLRDMKATLASTHSVTRFAFLDHFPYTHHVECAVLLEARG